MKRCPQCRRDYYDESLLYCLDDGTQLLDGPVSGPGIHGEAQTALLSEDAATRLHDSAYREGRRSSLWYFIPLVVVLAGALAFFLARPLLYGQAKQIQSIAVMPFTNESGTPDLDYLSDGITESLINSLSKVPKLSVKARSSVFHYQGKDVSPQQIASELSVQAVLKGRVMQRGDDLILSWELVDANSGDQLGGERYTRRASTLATLQGDIARDVSNVLRAKLSGADEQRVAKNYTQNTEAYQLYLKGKYHWNRRTGSDMDKALAYFQQAISVDPTYALAYSGLAETYILMPLYRNEDPQAAFPMARAAAQKALQLDDGLAEAHTAMASVLGDFEWKHDEAEREYQRATELNPNYATAHHWHAEHLAAMGKRKEALDEIKTALEVDPLSLIINGIAAAIYGLNGDYDRSLEQAKKTVDMDPNFQRSHIYLGEAYQRKGMLNEAAEEYYKVTVLNGGTEQDARAFTDSLKYALRRGGEKAYYLKLAEILTGLRNELQRNDGPPPAALVASYWVKAGDNEKAIQVLQQALERHDPDVQRVRFMPGLEPLFPDKRFQEIVAAAKLPPVEVASS